MDEQSVFDVDVRLVEYKNNNNFSLEQIREVWSSITGFLLLNVIYMLI